MQIATWNVNSIRTRLHHVIDWLGTNSIDLLCLQETKVVDQDFPVSAFESLGYHTYTYGQKTYNGVALLSREPLQEVTCGFTPVLGAEVVGDLDDQKRLISGSLQGIQVVNIYVPNGSEVGSEKYSYKLRWLTLLKTYLSQQLAQQAQVIVCGDFNIAPENRDIYNAKKAGEIMASESERQALQAISQLGFHDALRKFTPDPGYFSWWDYRAGGFQRNRGWRIDHHYLSSGVYEQASACFIDIEPRQADKPSDHAPVILELIL